MHPVVFLVGLHGSGKSSIGRHLVQKHQWRHISLGDIGRLARKGMRPSDVSLRLMSCLASYRPGEEMPARTCKTIASEVTMHSHASPVVCDGFPVALDQIRFLPLGSKLIGVECSDVVREERLFERASKTVRQWVPGNPSLRDQSLVSLIDAATEMGIFGGWVNNDTSGSNGLDSATSTILQGFCTAP